MISPCRPASWAGLALLIMTLGSSTARADTIVWNLQGVRFSDSGSATGTFSFDTVADTIVAWGLFTSGGDDQDYPDPFAYSSTTGTMNYFIDQMGDGTYVFREHWTGLTRELRFTFASPLSAPGPLPFDTGKAWGSRECSNCFPDRIITEGVVVRATPIPEPASLLLLGTGLAGLVRVARRRRQ